MLCILPLSLELEKFTDKVLSAAFNAVSAFHLLLKLEGKRLCEVLQKYFFALLLVLFVKFSDYSYSPHTFYIRVFLFA